MHSDMFQFLVLLPVYVDICKIKAIQACGRLLHGDVVFGTLLALLSYFSHVMQTETVHPFNRRSFEINKAI